MKERILLNKPIRKNVTDIFYEDKMSIDEFQEIIVSHFEPYKRNMENLGSPAIDEKYIEEWVEQYLAWLDIEQEN
jgi:uncharacterized protein YggL (DUF469 family)